MKRKIEEKFKSIFGAPPAALYAAPGRINLIGEHTDYNLGFVLPASIDKAIYVALRPVPGSVSRICSADYDAMAEIDFGSESKPDSQWACYVYGVAREMAARGRKPGAVEMVFGGDVPLGAGLSSSAALESAVGFALNDTFSLGFTRQELARIGQMTEHNYIGVRCGIMDQFASLLGRKGHVLKLDCRSLDYELVPFDPQGCRVVLLDTQVKHSLASSEYNTRRQQCEQGVAAVAQLYPQAASLRDVTEQMLVECRSRMPEEAYMRCSYVIAENRRLLEGCQALEKGDYATFGAMMFGSHEGLSKLYQVSCPELDFIAEAARNTAGVLGARMMGGGFGGCVIAVVEEQAYEGFIASVSSSFADRFGKAPRIIDVVIGDGARKLEQ